MTREKAAKIYDMAIKGGCSPKWHDGIFGEAWHCMCKDCAHHCDQQCSMLTEESIINGNMWRNNE